MMKSYTYEMTVDEQPDGSYVAYLGDWPTPLHGAGSTALQAIDSLVETIREWPITGANRWLSTTDGTKLARTFVPSFDPGKPGASS